MLGGVCAGIADYLDVDVALLRIATVALALTSGFGALAYVIAWAVIPEADEDEPDHVAPLDRRHTVAMGVGAALVGVGVVLLARQWMPWSGGSHSFWPVLIVAVGVLVLVAVGRWER
jgi:phage shock protein PspC (stress-responsive transcriptional regulator)